MKNTPAQSNATVETIVENLAQPPGDVMNSNAKKCIKINIQPINQRTGPGTPFLFRTEENAKIKNPVAAMSGIAFQFI